MAKTKGGLNDKQQRFVEEYLVDLNGKQAAIRAGYSEKTAEQQASRLLSNVKVEEAIEEAKAERSERTKIDSDWVLIRLAEEVEADLADLYHENGSLKSVHEWPLVWRRGLVSGVDVVQEFETVDSEKVSVGSVTKLKLSERIKRLELVGKHVAVQAFRERLEHTGKDGAPLHPPTISAKDALKLMQDFGRDHPPESPDD